MTRTPLDSSSGESAWASRGLDPAAVEALARRLPASQLWSLLLGVFEQRAARRTPSQLLRQWGADRFLAPSYLDQRTMLELDRALFACAPSFEAIELSPLAPLGACSALAPTSQHRILSALRGTEVVSDPTNVLALECARRLREDPTAAVKLATSHRCVRAQPPPEGRGFAAHFRIFCLATAGHERKDQAFTVDAFVEHIRTHLAALDQLEMLGYRFPDRRVTLLGNGERAPLRERIASSVDGPPVEQAPLRQPYYDGLRFMIHSGSATGEKIPLIDGGAFDWVAKLAANRKLVFIASAIGTQLAGLLYRQ